MKKRLAIFKIYQTYPVPSKTITFWKMVYLATDLHSFLIKILVKIINEHFSEKRIWVIFETWITKITLSQKIKGNSEFIN